MHWRRRRRRPRTTSASSRCSSARRTRTSRSACAARASCNWTGGRAPSATRRAWSRSSASPPASIPDYLALVGDAADGYPGLPGWGAEVDGGRAREIQAISSRSPPTGASGASTRTARPRWRRRWRRSSELAYLLFGRSRRSAQTSARSTTWTSCSGEARRQSLRLHRGPAGSGGRGEKRRRSRRRDFSAGVRGAEAGAAGLRVRTAILAPRLVGHEQPAAPLHRVGVAASLLAAPVICRGAARGPNRVRRRRVPDFRRPTRHSALRAPRRGL